MPPVERILPLGQRVSEAEAQLVDDLPLDDVAKDVLLDFDVGQVGHLDRGRELALFPMHPEPAIRVPITSSGTRPFGVQFE